MMQRRSFIANMGLATVFSRKAKVEVCKGCKQPGHQWTVGTVRPKRQEFGDYAFGGHESMAWWCPNAPVDWTFYERMDHAR